MKYVRHCSCRVVLHDLVGDFMVLSNTIADDDPRNLCFNHRQPAMPFTFPTVISREQDRRRTLQPHGLDQSPDLPDHAIGFLDRLEIFMTSPSIFMARIVDEVEMEKEEFGLLGFEVIHGLLESLIFVLICFLNRVHDSRLNQPHEIWPIGKDSHPCRWMLLVFHAENGGEDSGGIFARRFDRRSYRLPLVGKHTRHFYRRAHDHGRPVRVADRGKNSVRMMKRPGTLLRHRVDIWSLRRLDVPRVKPVDPDHDEMAPLTAAAAGKMAQAERHNNQQSLLKHDAATLARLKGFRDCGFTATVIADFL